MVCVSRKRSLWKCSFQSLSDMDTRCEVLKMYWHGPEAMIWWGFVEELLTKQRPSLALPCLVNTVIGNLETKNPQTCSSFHGQIKWHPHAFCIPYRIYFMCTWNPTYFGRLTQPFFNTYTVDLQVGCVRLPGCVGTHCVALYAGPFYSGTRVFQALMEVEG